MSHSRNEVHHIGANRIISEVEESSAEYRRGKEIVKRYAPESESSRVIRAGKREVLQKLAYSAAEYQRRDERYADTAPEHRAKKLPRVTHNVDSDKRGGKDESADYYCVSR